MDKKIQRNGGSLKISNDVIVKIAELATTEISGVALDNKKIAIAESSIPFSEKFTLPIKAKLIGDSAEIDVSIVVIQGHKAINVAESVQNSIKSAVQNMTGITVSKVNVRISGIRINKEETA